MRNCDILVFDEPARGVDVGDKSEIYRIMNGLAAEGKAIIVISSELPEVLRLSHRIAVMCGGRLTRFYRPMRLKKTFCAVIAGILLTNLGLPMYIGVAGGAPGRGLFWLFDRVS